ncbi:hypothetical protein KR018_009271, partial [Drosophila ironensis]
FITSGSTYKLLRALNLLDDRTLTFSREDSFELMLGKALEVMKKQHDKNERLYNLRSRPVSFEEGQEIFRRNFRPSNFQVGYNSKLEPAFVKARVRKRVGQTCYELEDLQGRYVGKYHAKDLRQ